MSKYTAVTDRLVARKRSLITRLGNAGNYVNYREDGKIASFDLEALAADEEALRVFRQELESLGVHYYRNEILAARRYWEPLTALELFEYYQGTVDKYADFAEYLVQSAYESWFSQAYDC